MSFVSKQLWFGYLGEELITCSIILSRYMKKNLKDNALSKLLNIIPESKNLVSQRNMEGKINHGIRDVKCSI